MAKIVPFRGVRYNLAKIADPHDVVTPPYDVISSDLQDDLYRRSPFNAVRLTLGKTNEGDTESDNRYTRAATDFNQWQEEGVLTRDEEPSLYLYDQEYTLEDGQKAVRQGFMALTRIEDFSSGVIKPHEETLPAPKVDRFTLTRVCGANFSPIFSLYSDPCCALEALARKEKERKPDLAVTDDDGVQHRLWCVTDATFIEKVRDLLASKPLFIAEGHHRYESALNYRNFMREKHPDYTGKELFNYVLMHFANMEDQGMTIFPIHRLITGLPGFRLEPLLEKLRESFEVEQGTFDPTDSAAREEIRATLKEKGEGGHTLGLFAGGENIYYLTLRDAGIMNRYFEEKAPKVLRTLDVSILHRLILEDILGLSVETQERQAHLKYVKNFDDPFELVQNGDFQLAFLMNATRMSEVRDVANAGGKMPQKSTYFYPKLLTGLVINKIVENETVTE